MRPRPSPRPGRVDRGPRPPEATPTPRRTLRKARDSALVRHAPTGHAPTRGPAHPTPKTLNRGATPTPRQPFIRPGTAHSCGHAHTGQPATRPRPPPRPRHLAHERPRPNPSTPFLRPRPPPHPGQRTREATPTPREGLRGHAHTLDTRLRREGPVRPPCPTQRTPEATPHKTHWRGHAHTRGDMLMRPRPPPRSRTVCGYACGHAPRHCSDDRPGPAHYRTPDHSLTGPAS